MANHPSALKRHRQSEKRLLRNHAIKTRLRHLIRDARAAVAAEDAGAAVERLARAERALDKAVTKGALHANSASRRISRLARAVGRLKQASG